MAAAATVLIARLPTTSTSTSTSTTVTRCSALPYLPPRLSSIPSFSTSLKQFPESRKSLLQTRASSSEETSTSTDPSELFTDLKQKWDALENKSTVLLYGGGAIVAVWLSSIFVGAINSVPLIGPTYEFLFSRLLFAIPSGFGGGSILPKIMELVGLGYTGWFVYRYLLFKSSRKELATDIEAIKKKIAGTE